MDEVTWAEPAFRDLDAIADFISLDNTEAAKVLVQNVFRHVGQLADHPKSGSKPQELKGWRYRQIVEPPGRNSYREEGSRVIILRIMRGERLLRPSALAKRSKLRNK